MKDKLSLLQEETHDTGEVGVVRIMRFRCLSRGSNLYEGPYIEFFLSEVMMRRFWGSFGMTWGLKPRLVTQLPGGG